MILFAYSTFLAIDYIYRTFAYLEFFLPALGILVVRTSEHNYLIAQLLIILNSDCTVDVSLLTGAWGLTTPYYPNPHVVTLYDIEVKWTFTHHDGGSSEHSSTGNTICIVIGVFDDSMLNLVANYMFIGTYSNLCSRRRQRFVCGYYFGNDRRCDTVIDLTSRHFQA